MDVQSLAGSAAPSGVVLFGFWDPSPHDLEQDPVGAPAFRKVAFKGCLYKDVYFHGDPLLSLSFMRMYLM